MIRINYMVKATTLSNGAEIWEAEEEFNTVGGVRKMHGVLLRVSRGSKPTSWYCIDVFRASIRKVDRPAKYEDYRTKLGGRNEI